MYTLGGSSLASAQRGRGGRGAAGGGEASQAPPVRRQVTIDGRRVRVVDVHAHCTVPEVGPVVKGTKFESQGGGGGNRALGPARIELIDRQGIDIQELSINGFWWYEADRELADRIVRAQNEGL